MEIPESTPEEIGNMILNAGSTPDTVCEGESKGYFTDDLNTMSEPLLLREMPDFSTVTIDDT
jgi:hypothetical protein